VQGHWISAIGQHISWKR